MPSANVVYLKVILVTSKVVSLKLKLLRSISDMKSELAHL